MRRAIALAVLPAVLWCHRAASAEALQSDDQVRATLTNLENKSWEAWKARDGSYFQSFTSPDHVDVGLAGTMGQAAVVAGVSSHACVVASYSLEPMKFVRVAPDAAMLIYRANQNTTCNGKPIPTPSWITSLYAWRDGRWQNVLFEDVPAKT
ncbi:MAG TPA: nuclear transport factor 2 family protein [Rhizomicrobium sp.]|jgi:hypothetical protein